MRKETKKQLYSSSATFVIIAEGVAEVYLSRDSEDLYKNGT